VNRFPWIFTVYLLILATPVLGGTDDRIRVFLGAAEDYKTGDYESAVSGFLSLAEKGVKNGTLFYNLGNSYFKKGDLGQSILWYERALRFLPDNPDLKFNYNHVLSFTKDEKGKRELPIFRVLFFWKYMLSQANVQRAAIILNVLFWTLLILSMFFKHYWLRMSGTLVLILAIVFIATSLYNRYESSHQKLAVILPEIVSVRSGFTPESTELFKLHAGTKVRVEKIQGNNFRIFFSEGKIGWIRKEDAGII